jgi:hypothetical protein
VVSLERVCSLERQKISFLCNFSHIFRISNFTFQKYINCFRYTSVVRQENL